MYIEAHLLLFYIDQSRQSSMVCSIAALRLHSSAPVLKRIAFDLAGIHPPPSVPLGRYFRCFNSIIPRTERLNEAIRILTEQRPLSETSTLDSCMEGCEIMALPQLRIKWLI